MNNENDGGAAMPAPPAMTMREINLAMAALTMALFVAYVSNLVVLTALPRIVADLRGSQASYSWIVTASMMMMTVCMPIWGRMSEYIDKKRMIQLCVFFYVAMSALAGLAGSTDMVILCRAAIGVNAAGIIILMQAIAVEIATPRHRARWIGYQGAVISCATVGAPTLGGLVAQHLGWRWCFFLAIPIAIVALTMLQRTLHLRPRSRVARPRVDWPGALLVAASIITMMLWVSVFGPERGWLSLPAIPSLAGGCVLIGITIFIERRTTAPILPLDLFRNRDVRLGAIGAFVTGFAFFGSAVYLAIFLQVGRGFGPQVAGLMALPEAVAALLGSVISSRFIARHGRYRGWMLSGGAMVCLGFLLLTRVNTETSLVFIGTCVALIGGGLGMASENLGLVAQTAVENGRAGAASGLINFSRMIGGITCVAAMGALLSYRVASYASAHGLPLPIGASLPKPAAVPPDQRAILASAYVSGIGSIYLVCMLVALGLVACIWLLSDRTLETEHS